MNPRANEMYMSCTRQIVRAVDNVIFAMVDLLGGVAVSLFLTNL